MANRNEHLVVIMLEPANFSVEFEVWPQHITIVPWFPCDDADRLNETLAAAAQRHKPFKIQVLGVELWGKKDKYQVVTFEPSNDLQALHTDVFASLEFSGFPVHQKDFLGERYRPHIAVRNLTQKEQPYPTSGQVISINNFSLVAQTRLKKSGRMIKRVVKDYNLL